MKKTSQNQAQPSTAFYSHLKPPSAKYAYNNS